MDRRTNEDRAAEAVGVESDSQRAMREAVEAASGLKCYWCGGQASVNAISLACGSVCLGCYDALGAAGVLSEAELRSSEAALGQQCVRLSPAEARQAAWDAYEASVGDPEAAPAAWERWLAVRGW